MKPIEQVRTFQDESAAQSWRKAEATRTTVLALATSRMLDLVRLEPGHHVLVIGAGTGDEALDAAARVGRSGEIVATDGSEAMVQEMRRRITTAQIHNVRSLQMDAQRLGFEDESFDAVIARNVLQFIPDLLGCLSEVRRVLRTGSRLGATVWAAAARNPARSDPVTAARALGLRPARPTHLQIATRLGTPGQLSNALRAARFTEVVVERVAAAAHYASLESAVAETMEHPGTRQLVGMLPHGSEVRLAQSLSRRWRRYSGPAGTVLPGEQLAAVARRI